MSIGNFKHSPDDSNVPSITSPKCRNGSITPLREQKSARRKRVMKRRLWKEHLSIFQNHNYLADKRAHGRVLPLILSLNINRLILSVEAPIQNSFLQIDDRVFNIQGKRGSF